MTTDQIKRAIRDSGQTQKSVAAKMGMTPQGFNSKLVRVSFSDEEFQQMAEILGVRYVSEFQPADREELQRVQAQIDVLNELAQRLAVAQSCDTASIVHEAMTALLKERESLSK